ncbi:ROK family transcriptional regulator [Clostridiales bacterium COT073_COT-073]|nr:ROK family transcriptional regulator [Clostridiales bacterium COT073_COT-073]
MIVLQDLSQEIIKNTNRRRILNLIRQEKKITKAEIAKRLNLSIPTVTGNIAALEEAGFLKQSGVADSTGGRPPVVIEFLENSYYSVGVDVRLKSTEVMMVNLNYQIITREILPFGLSTSMDRVVKGIDGWIAVNTARLQIDNDRILGIGFSFHGIVDQTGLLIKFTFENQWFDFSEYKKILKWPVFLENEANLAAKAELEIGISSAEAHDIVFLSINQGVGTGIVINDYLYKGSASKAGEFGHMIIYGGGQKCQCGELGCWEAYVSVPAFEKSYFKGATAAAEIFKAYVQGEPAAVSHIQSYIRYLALGIRNILMVLDPHYVIIGGEMSLYAHTFIEELTEHLHDSVRLFNPSKHILRISDLKKDASILGAALLPIEKTFNLNHRIL